MSDSSSEESLLHSPTLMLPEGEGVEDKDAPIAPLSLGCAAFGPDCRWCWRWAAQEAGLIKPYAYDEEDVRAPENSPPAQGLISALGTAVRTLRSFLTRAISSLRPTTQSDPQPIPVLAPFSDSRKGKAI